MNKTRVGVVGIGRMGQRHCRVFSNWRNASLVGVYDVDRSAAETVAAQYEIQCFDNYPQLLASVDAISIATDTPSHVPLAIEAIENGIHVMVEKPMAETLEQANLLVEKAVSQSCVIQVGHIERFNPAYIELKNIIEGTRLVAVNVRRLSPFEKSKIDVDVVRDLMIHDLDLMMDLLGCEFELASARGRSLRSDTIDYAVANFSYDDGPIVTLTASRVTEHKIRSIEITADNAYIQADLLAKNVTIHRKTSSHFVDRPDTNLYRQDGFVEHIYVPSVEPLANELHHFLECIQNGKPTSVPAAKGLLALKLASDISAQAISNSI